MVHQDSKLLALVNTSLKGELCQRIAAAAISMQPVLRTDPILPHWPEMTWEKTESAGLTILMTAGK